MDEVTSKVRRCHHMRPQIYRSAKHLCISPHTMRPCTRRSRQSHLFFPPSLTSIRIPMDQRSKAPAEPLAQQCLASQSHGATARPCRCHFQTSPGWSVVMNQHFPSSERRGAAPKHARLRAEEGTQSSTSSRVLFVATPVARAEQKMAGAGAHGTQQEPPFAHPPALDQECPAVLNAPSPTRLCPRLRPASPPRTAAPEGSCHNKEQRAPAA